MLEITEIPAFKDNYIWMIRQGQNAVVVDPGDARPVVDRLEAEGLILRAILITHHHADHQGGIADLTRRWPVAVYGPGRESITGCSHPLFGGESLPLLGETVRVMAVPGHTLGHLAYGLGDAVFCGDTLFGAGCGRLFEGTPAQMATSLASLVVLPAATRLYCAHEYTEANLRFALTVEPGNATLVERVQRVAAQRAAGQITVPLSLAEELATNPFLRCSEPEVCAVARREDPEATDEVSVFAALRALRNRF